MGRIADRTVRAWFALLAAAAALLPAASCFGQEGPPPQPQLPRAPAPWIGYAVMVLLVSVVMAVSLMPSKRGHQD